MKDRDSRVGDLVEWLRLTGDAGADDIEAVMADLIAARAEIERLRAKISRVQCPHCGDSGMVTWHCQLCDTPIEQPD